jgi:hypothetical protein
MQLEVKHGDLRAGRLGAEQEAGQQQHRRGDDESKDGLHDETCNAPRMTAPSFDRATPRGARLA